MFEDLCTTTGFIVFCLLGAAFGLWMIDKMVTWLIEKFYGCKHEWEFYDCGDDFIQIKCKKCDEIKLIECDINKSEWKIEYIGRND